MFNSQTCISGTCHRIYIDLIAFCLQVSDAHLKINPASGKKNDGHGIARGIVYFALAGPIFVLGAMMGE